MRVVYKVLLERTNKVAALFASKKEANEFARKSRGAKLYKCTTEEVPINYDTQSTTTDYGDR